MQDAQVKKSLLGCYSDLIHKCQTQLPCADPESFVRGGPTLTTFFFEGKEDPNKYYYKRAIIDPPSKHHLNGVSLTGRY